MRFDGTRLIAADEEPALFPENIAHSGEPEGPPAITETVRNLGAGQAQNLIHAPHTLLVESRRWTVTEAGVSVPLQSAVQRIDLSGALVNYLLINPTGSGQTVYVSLAGYIEWVLSGGVYFPIGDIVVPSGGGSLFVPVPARDNYVIALVGWSNPLGLTTDAVHLCYGYQSIGRERLLLE